MWRSIPHPNYGNYGGARNTHKNKEPIDWMDNEFKEHDEELAANKYNRYRKKVADYNLLIGLVYGKSQHLARPYYGRLYRLGCIIIFAIIVKVT